MHTCSCKKLRRMKKARWSIQVLFIRQRVRTVIIVITTIMIDQQAFFITYTKVQHSCGAARGLSFLQGTSRASGLTCSVAFFIALFLLAYVPSALLSEHADAKRAQQPQQLQGQEVCNWFSGSWVHDNLTRPLYSALNCSFMNDEVNCVKYGRKDLDYQHWRWQPDGCDIPRFDAESLLKKLRGKRMVFVGDSLIRNQWLSLVCMVESVVSTEQKTRTFNGSIISFKAHEYNATIDFYWSPMLVESNGDDPFVHRVSERIIRPRAIEKHAKQWSNADILIFNSYHWWTKPLKVKMLQSSLEDANPVSKKVPMARGFELALRAWSEFLEMNISPNRTKIYFVSLSPTHEWSKEWGSADDHKCLNETSMINVEGYTGKRSDYGMMRKVKAIIDELKQGGLEVQLLNVSQLSEYRKDGHPSVYRRLNLPLTKEHLKDPMSYTDCVHWCLPGVPDVWNEILYAYIMSK